MSLEGTRGARTAESSEFFGVHQHLIGLDKMLLKRIRDPPASTSNRATKTEK
jgi:hypothetical protein